MQFLKNRIIENVDHPLEPIQRVLKIIARIFREKNKLRKYKINRVIYSRIKFEKIFEILTYFLIKYRMNY